MHLYNCTIPRYKHLKSFNGEAMHNIKNLEMWERLEWWGGGGGGEEALGGVVYTPTEFTALRWCSLSARCVCVCWGGGREGGRYTQNSQL